MNSDSISAAELRLAAALDNPGIGVTDSVLDSMSDSFKSAAAALRGFASQGGTIYLRYHNDGDGICAALCLKIALEYIGCAVASKASGGATYLESEAFSDAAFLASKPGKPVAVFLDFATNPESVRSLGSLKSTTLGISIISIDHHPPAMGLSDACDLCVNQHSAGADVNYSAGILASKIACEIAGQASPLTPFFNDLGALSLACDKSSLAPKSENIERLAFALDFSATSKKKGFGLQDALNLLTGPEEFMTAWAYAQEMFMEIEPYYEAAVQKKAIGKVEFHSLNLDYLRKKSSSLPPSRIVDFYFWRVVQGNPSLPIAVVGFSDRLVTFRANKEAVACGFRSDLVIEEIKKSLQSGIDGGGGHASAASVRMAGGMGAIVEELAMKKIAEMLNSKG